MNAGRIKHAIIVILATAIIVMVLWIDVTTTVWQDLVILSGLAASLVTFLVTTVFIERVVRRERERKWQPVTSFVLTEILHGLADTEMSETARGHIVARQLPVNIKNTARLRSTVLHERDQLATLLASWWEFLSEASDTDEIITHIAELSTQFDEIRDWSLALDRANNTGAPAEIEQVSRSLTDSIQRCNTALAGAVAEIHARLDRHRSHTPQRGQLQS